jgi:glutathione synthase/RimK-type ligase-like ATP-grasp enzyme
MKLGIHYSKGSFSERWIAYCNANSIKYKLVDCYKSNIIHQLSDCDALMWHFNHKGPKDSKFAKQLLYSVEASGKRVFPDYRTMWHFDDKVGQKYLLESIGAPLAPVFVFYTKKEAIEWANQTIYPKVFKMRTGAGSDNVKLVKSKNAAYKLIKKAFGKGFKQYEAWSDLKERYRKFRLGKTTLWDLTKGVIRLVYTTEFSRVTGPEKGYIYFQDFVPANDHDIRVVIIGDKAYAIKRMVRANDFRASGSGNILYDKNLFDENTVKLSFEVAEKLQTQCVAFDFVYDRGNPLIVEISYGFSPEGYDPCPGYWDIDLNWHEGQFDPYGWMVEDLLKAKGEVDTVQSIKF